MIRLSELRAWPARLLAFARSAEPRPALSSTALGLVVLLACVAVIASLMFEVRVSSPVGSAGLAAVLTTTATLRASGRWRFLGPRDTALGQASSIAGLGAGIKVWVR
jgi:hypothetical protein